MGNTNIRIHPEEKSIKGSSSLCYLNTIVKYKINTIVNDHIFLKEIVFFEVKIYILQFTALRNI